MRWCCFGFESRAIANKKIMERTISDIIQQIESDKKERKIVPSFAIYIDVINEAIKEGYQLWQVNAELRKLKNSNQILTGRTINSTYISWQRNEE